MQIGIIGSGDVGTTLAKGLDGHGYRVTIGTRSPEKLRAVEDLRHISVRSVEEAASEATDLLILAVKGSAALDALRPIGRERLRGRIIVDATNPITDAAPEQGVLSFFTDRNSSLMEMLQKEYPEARFVKAFNSVGAASMIDPQFEGGRPTMFICGDDLEAKQTVTELLDAVGWEAADMGGRGRRACHRAAVHSLVCSGFP